MRRRVAFLLVAGALLAGVVLPACGTDGPTGSGYALDADLLRRPAPPPADPWLVRVATARAEVPEIVARRTPPPSAELTAARGPVVPEAPLGGTHLTPIPSAALSWDSTEVEDGWSFSNPTRIGSPRVFVVTADHGDWLQVMAPLRPNHLRAWIRADDVTLTEHRFHLEIDVTTNSLRVFDGDQLLIETATVDGTPSTPTPIGRFYVNEVQQVDPSSAYGSYIMSTNGYSDSLERFSGEVPIFAVHGTNNPAAVGTDRSNGCVRVPNEVIERMVALVPLGTPVDVFAS